MCAQHSGVCCGNRSCYTTSSDLFGETNFFRTQIEQRSLCLPALSAGRIFAKDSFSRSLVSSQFAFRKRLEQPSAVAFKRWPRLNCRAFACSAFQFAVRSSWLYTRLIEKRKLEKLSARKMENFPVSFRSHETSRTDLPQREEWLFFSNKTVLLRQLSF